MNRKFLHETLHDNIDCILDKRIAILGCGAIGANLAVSLARRGFRKFMLMDYDKIDEHNFSTQPWESQDLGRLKVRALSKIIYSINGESKAYTDWKKLVSAKDIINRVNAGWAVSINLYVDCFDNSESRKAAQDLYPGCSVLHVGMSNQNTGEVRWADNYAVPPNIELDDPCNYPLARTLVELTVTVASESVIQYLKNGVKDNYFINANNLKISCGSNHESRKDN